jgi:hypothetical protein
MNGKNDLCKVAIIGAGYTAREHIHAFADVPGVRLAGIHSRTRSKAETLAKEYTIPHVCDSVDELYEKTKADLVVVTVVEMSMRPVCEACFQYPWTLLLEKPAGYTVPDAEAILAAAQKNKSNVFVALNRRFYSSTRFVLSDCVELDGPRFVKVQDQQDQASALSTGQPKAVVDNWMFANSIHLIDYFHVFCRGKIEQVEPIIPWNPVRPGVVIGKILFDSGDVGIYEGVWDGPAPWAVAVSTSSRRWEMRPLEHAVYQNRGERALIPAELNQWDKLFKPGFRLQAENAAAAALGRLSNSVSIDEAMKTMRLIQRIFSLEN